MRHCIPEFGIVTKSRDTYPEPRESVDLLEGIFMQGTNRGLHARTALGCWVLVSIATRPGSPQQRLCTSDLAQLARVIPYL